MLWPSWGSLNRLWHHWAFLGAHVIESVSSWAAVAKILLRTIACSSPCLESAGLFCMKGLTCLWSAVWYFIILCSLCCGLSLHFVVWPKEGQPEHLQSSTKVFTCFNGQNHSRRVCVFPTSLSLKPFWAFPSYLMQFSWVWWKTEYKWIVSLNEPLQMHNNKCLLRSTAEGYGYKTHWSENIMIMQ